MMTIMIIEDEEMIREELSSLLESAGYSVIAPTDFQNVTKQVLDVKPDLLLLDIQLPGVNGEVVLKTIREHSSLPVIMVTSRNTEIDEVLSMSYGADDYITKPYNPTLLLLRVQAVLKRTQNVKNEEITYEDIHVDMKKGVLKTGDHEEVLTKNEMLIFSYLLNHRQGIVSRDELMTTLWDHKEYISDNALTVNISRLRKKLKNLGHENAIETRKGQGYILA
ncbi:response regulator transcription factor [Intestinibaculum porci]|uniref:DNA-binding response regulator n=1 Tax=Intestinibaculum porci TaxID=2487118 RepID=A0A3G9J5I7_9FIRM|nr:response regulator transcription factor [Intestinibaculum porci]MDD6348472.1 response regulator transcription factor [Intestinibaculum porci]BBH26360.1 DNA-binding response regulator [Intestinibaculum porci]